jgi:class 3 adenylate cyclase
MFELPTETLTPSTVFFTGHMIDRPGRMTPRFPMAIEPVIARRISGELEVIGPTDGFASAAAGGDILFLEALIARGGRAHITLPCAIDAFRLDCVDVVPGSNWRTRFERLLTQAHSVEILGEQYASDNAMASECCNRVMIGLARLCAHEKGETDPLVLALWDGRPGDAYGGTQSAVDFCLRHGLPVRSLEEALPTRPPASHERSPTKSGTTSAVQHGNSVPEGPQQICSAVFADVVGFSRLKERQIPAFFDLYLLNAMQSLQSRRIVPLVKNTWGDGLYLAFESPRDAGLFALDFANRIAACNWRPLSLSFVPSVRIGIHAGPLYRFYDPLIAQWSYTGSHVTRAARLEPVAESGKVIATQAFVALAAAEGIREFCGRGLGRRKLLKGAGEIILYELVTAPAGPSG